MFYFVMFLFQLLTQYWTRCWTFAGAICIIYLFTSIHKSNFKNFHSHNFTSFSLLRLEKSFVFVHSEIEITRETHTSVGGDCESKTETEIQNERRRRQRQQRCWTMAAGFTHTRTLSHSRLLVQTRSLVHICCLATFVAFILLRKWTPPTRSALSNSLSLSPWHCSSKLNNSWIWTLVA